jgi:hypothetical protein
VGNRYEKTLESEHRPNARQASALASALGRDFVGDIERGAVQPQLQPFLWEFTRRKTFIARARFDAAQFDSEVTAKPKLLAS